ncbi:MAG: beta-lactamase family protein [Microscillaceae bacterium]|jgi:D-alanyl-D-alanine carboxypeptidase|nr:beta-lactamase family protein [Microscillaceae bacterium]
MKSINFKSIISLFSAFLILTSCSTFEVPFAQNPLPCNVDYSNHPKNAQWSQLIKEVALKNNAPGIVMLIEKQSQLWQGAYGKAHLESNQAVSVCHQFRIASITKTFTAAMIMKLVEQGQLNLNQTIKELLPELSPEIKYADKMTLTHLLNHTSGMYSLGSGNTKLSLWVANSPEKFAKYDPYWQLKEFVFAFKPYSEPGKLWSYNNANYVLLGLILEKISGKKYANLLNEIILTPAQMTSTSLLESEDRSKLASGYTNYMRQGILFNSYRYDQYAYESPYGGIYSNAEDLLKFAKFLFKSNFLTENTRQKMLDWAKLPDCPNGNCEYGLGIELWRFKGSDGFGHGGAFEGYNSTMLYFPNKDTFLVFLTNRGAIPKDFFEEFLKD